MWRKFSPIPGLEEKYCTVPERLRHSAEAQPYGGGHSGKERVEGVTIAEVDEHLKPIPGTEEQFSCDTLLLSVGLIPENELSKEIGVELSPCHQRAQSQ